MTQIFLGPFVMYKFFFPMQNVGSVITSFQQMSIFVKNIQTKENKFIVDVEMEFYWKTVHL